MEQIIRYPETTMQASNFSDYLQQQDNPLFERLNTAMASIEAFKKKLMAYCNDLDNFLCKKDKEELDQLYHEFCNESAGEKRLKKAV